MKQEKLKTTRYLTLFERNKFCRKLNPKKKEISKLARDFQKRFVNSKYFCVKCESLFIQGKVTERIFIPRTHFFHQLNLLYIFSETFPFTLDSFHSSPGYFPAFLRTQYIHSLQALHLTPNCAKYVIFRCRGGHFTSGEEEKDNS
jgi:hypothetical protein